MCYCVLGASLGGPAVTVPHYRLEGEGPGHVQPPSQSVLVYSYTILADRVRSLDERCFDDVVLPKEYREFTDRPFGSSSTHYV